MSVYVGSCRMGRMTTSTPSPALKALKYAEDQLGVNTVYTDCLTSREQLDTTLTELSEARDHKRDLESRIIDVEMDVAASERGSHPEMSQAAMDKHMKVALHNNDDWRELREQLVLAVGTVDGLECDKTMHETDIRIAVSRMQELGGYLQYLAAVKQSNSTNKTSEQEAGTT